MSNVFSISEAVSIGFHACVIIASENKILNATQIAEKIDASKHHTTKVLQKLTKCKILASIRGPRGGFYLNKSADILCLLDIYQAIEGLACVPHCPAEHEECSFDKCIIGDIVPRMIQEFYQYLENKKLSDCL